MITAVITEGVSIAGGSGTIPGVVLAMFILGLATFGLSLVNVPGIVISILLGLLLIVSHSLPLALLGPIKSPATLQQPEPFSKVAVNK